MHWEIEIDGDKRVLRQLCDSFNSAELDIFEKNNSIYLRSNSLDVLNNAKLIRREAQDIVTSISGISNFLLNLPGYIGIKKVTRINEDGTKNIYASIQESAIASDSVSVIVTNKEGKVIKNEPDERLKNWYEIAQDEDSVKKVLRLRNANSVKWVDLYRIYEVIEVDVGKNHIIEMKWLSNSNIILFKRTANSVEAVGDEARHGKENTEPPKKPMTLSEARSLVDGLITSWMQEKVNNLEV